MRALMMLVVMVSLLVACGSADSNATNQEPTAEAPVENVAENSAGDDTAAEPTVEESSSDDAGATDESVWQPDVNRNLDGINSYVSTFTYSATPEGGEAQEWSWRQVVNRNPFASDTTTTNVAGEGMGEFRMVVIGDQSYLITEGSQCMAITDQNNQNEMMDPQSFMSASTYDMRKDGSGPTIDGRATDKYVGEYNDGANTVTSIAYVDPTTEITMRWEVSGTSDSNGAKETFTWAYELSEIDAAPKVEMPAECQAMTEASAYPKTDDAQVTMQSAEMFAYTTSQALADVVEFYTQEMPAAGYTEVEGSMTMSDMSMLSYTKDGKTVSVMITVQDGKTNVIITAQ
jgi:hypothetical protein